MVKPGWWLWGAKPWPSGAPKPWLSVTPEPERELPRAVATLVHGGDPPAALVAVERDRIERLVLHGSERAWLSYLHGVVEMIDRRAGDDDLDVTRALQRATTVIANHHNLLLGLPGRGAALTAADRARLARRDTSGFHNHQPRGHP